jgi:hypothetical protein
MCGWVLNLIIDENKEVFVAIVKRVFQVRAPFFHEWSGAKVVDAKRGDVAAQTVTQEEIVDANGRVLMR